MSGKPWSFPPAAVTAASAARAAALAGGAAAPSVAPDAPCPCGSGLAYGRCCRPHHVGEARPATAEALMRARYSAFAAGQADFLWRTWHPRTRPELITLDESTEWTGLEIVDVVDGADGDRDGVVEFRARYVEDGAPGVLHERSRFTVRARRWMYVDGEHYAD
ncbi:YchJ family protein [Corynebacterium sp. 335C]